VIAAPRRGAVGEQLRARGRRLRVADEALDAGERRVVAGRGDLDAQPRIGRDRAGGDGVADAAGDGARLAGDHRLVDVGLSVDHPAVGGDAAAGPHDDDIADGEVGGRHRHDAVALDPLGLVGQESGERVERRRGRRERAHLDPVPEQHDDDEERQLPPELELVVQDAEARAPRREEGDRDRERDEGHHAGPAAAELVAGAREERPSAPHVHDGAEDGGDPAQPRRDRVAEDHREHRRQRHHRHREHEIDPEQATEPGDVPGVAAVTGVGAVPRVVGVRHVRHMVAVSRVLGVLFVHPGVARVVVWAGRRIGHPCSPRSAAPMMRSLLSATEYPPGVFLRRPAGVGARPRGIPRVENDYQ